MKFLTLSWDEIYTKSIRLASKLRHDEDGSIDCLIGVSRGGLVLARILSDLLDVQNVMITKCEYYLDLGQRKRKPVITQKIQGSIAGRNVLVVDDVADTGESLIEIKKYIKSKHPKRMRVATIYIKPQSKALPDYYVSKTDAWIIFPWELYEAMKSMSANKKANNMGRMKIPPKYLKMIYEMDHKLGQTSAGAAA
ncbi:MAG: phosphoribosyltransferase [Nitrososphaerales archaeon]